MNRSFTAPAVALWAICAFSGAAQADVNLAQGAAITLSGDQFGASPDWWSAGTGFSAHSLHDGATLEEGTQWNQGSVYWSGFGAEAASVTFTLSGPSVINRLFAQVDTNDDYAVSYRDLTGSWHALATLSPERLWGLRSVGIDLETPVSATALQITANGDNAYALSEFSVFGSPVPEASTWLMMIGGLLAVGAYGLMRDRRNSR